MKSKQNNYFEELELLAKENKSPFLKIEKEVSVQIDCSIRPLIFKQEKLQLKYKDIFLSVPVCDGTKALKKNFELRTSYIVKVNNLLDGKDYFMELKSSVKDILINIMSKNMNLALVVLHIGKTGTGLNTKYSVLTDRADMEITTELSFDNLEYKPSDKLIELCKQIEAIDLDKEDLEELKLKIQGAK